MTQAKPLVRQQDPASQPWDDFVQQDRVHRSVYTDPAIFELEMRKIFGGTWAYLGHESEILQPYDFVARRLGPRPLILTRDHSGQVHALFNRCSHRSATVCREAKGSARYFTCGYHGWVYNSAGELVSVPLQEAYGAAFDCARYHLAHVPFVEIYRGFIFGTLNPEAPSLRDYLGHARELLDQWLDRAPTGEVVVRSATHRFLVRANWKLIYDNAGDGYHPGFSHQSLLMMAQRYGQSRDMTYFQGNPDDTRMYAQSLGSGGHTFIDQRPEMHAISAWQQQRPQPGREAYEAQLRKQVGDREAERLLEVAVGSGMNLNIFPNLLVIGNQIQVIEPLAVDRTQLTWYATTITGVPEAINVLRMRTQEDFPNFGEVDDVANWEACQEGLSIPEIEWVDMSRHLDTGQERIDARGVITGPVTDDLHLRAYYQEWKRLMSADLRLVVA
jgi:phenylpropionate dioxygenase-like ring-hydroxylating dioxygenase large terminal subunit